MSLLKRLDGVVLRVQRPVAYMMFFGGIIGWPIASLTWAREEYQTTLGLSFLAIIYSGFNALQIEVNSVEGETVA